MKRTYSNNLKLFVAVSTHLSITTLNGHGLDAPVKQRVDIYLMEYSAAIKKKKQNPAICNSTDDMQGVLLSQRKTDTVR